MTLDSFSPRIIPLSETQSDMAVGITIITSTVTRQEDVFRDPRWQRPFASNTNSATDCKNHYCLLALGKKIFVYAGISICIITTQWRHYLSVQLA